MNMSLNLSSGKEGGKDILKLIDMDTIDWDHGHQTRLIDMDTFTLLEQRLAKTLLTRSRQSTRTTWSRQKGSLLNFRSVRVNDNSPDSLCWTQCLIYLGRRGICWKQKRGRDNCDQDRAKGRCDRERSGQTQITWHWQLRQANEKMLASRDNKSTSLYWWLSCPRLMFNYLAIYFL